MTDALDPVVLLGRRLAAAATEHGLELVHYIIVPCLDGSGLHAMQVTYAVTEDALKDPEQARIDAEFKQMMRADKEREIEGRAVEARKGLEKMREAFESGEDFLG